MCDIDGPGPFECKTRPNESYLAGLVDRVAEMLYYRRLVRSDYNNTAQQIYGNASEKNKRCYRLFEKFIKPRLGNFEAELIIDSGRGGTEYAAGLIYNAQQSAVERRSTVLVFESRAVYVQHDIESSFCAEDNQKDWNSPADYGQQRENLKMCQCQSYCQPKA
ncbi:hypothetical protein ES703_28168 [subsurface metagenome]